MNILTIIGIAVVIIPSITSHEAAHGFAANRLGDPTARQQGRITLNPIPHLDPMGSVIVPLILVGLNTGFIFGWAKPVPVDWRNFKHPKRDMAWVAVAGPVSNLLMALLWALAARAALGMSADNWIALPLLFMGVAGIFINTILMVLNLLPLPPLDGGRVVTGLLPAPYAYQFARIEPYGFFILVALLVTGVLSIVMWPVVKLFLQMMASVAGMKPGYLETILFALMRS